MRRSRKSVRRVRQTMSNKEDGEEKGSFLIFHQTTCVLGKGSTNRLVPGFLLLGVQVQVRAGNDRARIVDWAFNRNSLHCDAFWVCLVDGQKLKSVEVTMKCIRAVPLR
ncbi:hypothetical protein RJ55_08460 [Drechmeria coniospora]|nr:hypothetical protein RJ55_08460 [Drechmeria coniospora]